MSPGIKVLLVWYGIAFLLISGFLLVNREGRRRWRERVRGRGLDILSRGIVTVGVTFTAAASQREGSFLYHFIRFGVVLGGIGIGIWWVSRWAKREFPEAWRDILRAKEVDPLVRRKFLTGFVVRVLPIALASAAIFGAIAGIK